VVPIGKYVAGVHLDIHVLAKLPPIEGVKPEARYINVDAAFFRVGPADIAFFAPALPASRRRPKSSYSRCCTAAPRHTGSAEAGAGIKCADRGAGGDHVCARELRRRRRLSDIHASAAVSVTVPRSLRRTAPLPLPLPAGFGVDGRAVRPEDRQFGGQCAERAVDERPLACRRGMSGTTFSGTAPWGVRAVTDSPGGARIP